MTQSNPFSSIMCSQLRRLVDDDEHMVMYLSNKNDVTTATYKKSKESEYQQFIDTFFPGAIPYLQEKYRGYVISIDNFVWFYFHCRYQMYVSDLSRWAMIIAQLNIIKPTMQQIGSRIHDVFIGLLRNIHNKYPELRHLTEQEFCSCLVDLGDMKQGPKKLSEQDILRIYCGKCSEGNGKDASNAYNDMGQLFLLVVGFIERLVQAWPELRGMEGELLDLARSTKVEAMWVKSRSFALITYKMKRIAKYRNLLREWNCKDKSELEKLLVKWRLSDNLEDQTLVCKSEDDDDDDLEDKDDETESTIESPLLLTPRDGRLATVDEIFQRILHRQEIEGDRFDEKDVSCVLNHVDCHDYDSFVKQYNLDETSVNQWQMGALQEIQKDIGFRFEKLYSVVRFICSQASDIELSQDVSMNAEKSFDETPSQKVPLEMPPETWMSFPAVQQTNVPGTQPPTAMFTPFGNRPVARVPFHASARPLEQLQCCGRGSGCEMCDTYARLGKNVTNPAWRQLGGNVQMNSWCFDPPPPPPLNTDMDFMSQPMTFRGQHWFGQSLNHNPRVVGFSGVPLVAVQNCGFVLDYQSSGSPSIHGSVDDERQVSPMDVDSVDEPGPEEARRPDKAEWETFLNF